MKRRYYSLGLITLRLAVVALNWRVGQHSGRQSDLAGCQFPSNGCKEVPIPLEGGLFRPGYIDLVRDIFPKGIC